MVEIIKTKNFTSTISFVLPEIKIELPKDFKEAPITTKSYILDKHFYLKNLK